MGRSPKKKIKLKEASMKKSEPSREPSVRKAFVLALGGLTFLLLCAGVALRPRTQVQDQAQAAAMAEAPPEPRTAVQPGASARTETLKPEVVRAGNSPLSDIQISLKLDPRLTRGLHMGDRWVSPPTYTRVGEKAGCIVPIKVQGVDTQGKPVAITPEWRVNDAGMATVSTAAGNSVNLAAQHAGQTSVEVTALGLTKRLTLNVTEREEGILIMELTQPPGPAPQMAQAALAYTAPASQSGSANPPGPSARPHRHRRGQPVPVPEELSDVVAQLQAVQEQLGGSAPAEPDPVETNPQ